MAAMGARGSAIVIGSSWALALALGGGCSAPGGPGSAGEWDWRPKTDAGTTPDPGPRVCLPARSAEPIRARSDVMSADIAPRERTMFTEQLFDLVNSHCGGCHVITNQGEFQIKRSTFPVDFTDEALARIKSNDPLKFMPPLPTGKAYDSRGPGDAVVEMVSLLEIWIAQGRPPGTFTIPSGMEPGSTMRYLLTTEVGLGLTNIGDCVPSKAMVAISRSTMDDLDTFFAGAQELPDSLVDTDLSTLDGTTLAQQGVIAFAPGYPLWSDAAGKLRHIRVPRGQSVKFDKAKQQFQIPPNTRFYKTFLKKVVDREGNESFRKIETRLIVSRPDRKLADGTMEPGALFGTYVWNDDESEARLLKLPLRNGEPFTDSLLIYTTNEPREQAIRDTNPASLVFALKNEPGLLRHYAIPGSTRCVQCHMGSVMGNFVLGFLPLQIHRRPLGAGGVYEPPGEDELNQLQRLIDYGIVSGMTSAADILPLESSQGSRKPRNEHELTAQAYMLGNCAHCHNPGGFPSMKNPELKDTLDFMPSATGGVFQFPLERYSPLRKRGPGQDIPIPYITPSLRDLPIEIAFDINSPRKYVTTCACQNDAATTGFCDRDAFTQFVCGGRRTGSAFILAPWRSLIYRNVDTPFMYADDYTIFPHMPMHTPGFDCRAPQIMGDWMASIPAVRKHPEIPENGLPEDDDILNGYDMSPQPYVEVKPGEPGYDTAAGQIDRVFYTYHNLGGRYGYCPDQSDIVDPLVLADTTGRTVVPETKEVWDPQDASKLLWPALGPPSRAHWVVTDLTDPAGDWYPRRADWEKYVVEGTIETDKLASSGDQRAWDLDQQNAVLNAVRSVKITPELRALALTEIPYGLWERKPACNFSSVPKVSAFAPGPDRPRWIDREAPPPDAPVYMQSPGGALYSNICFNCHGPAADSKGLLSEAMMNMTGGTARVANFRDGLFGPLATPAANRQRIFGPIAAETGLTADDWAARYMSWMALGGTKVRIPSSILSIVGVTRILGEARGASRVGTEGSANMLNLARELCGHVVPVVPLAAGESRVELDTVSHMFWNTGMVDFGERTGLIASNADAEMWLRLCSLGNRQIVRVVHPDPPDWTSGLPRKLGIHTIDSLYWADGYPAGAPVMDHRGRVTAGIDAGNLFPLCVLRPTGAANQTAADQYLDAHRVGPDRAKMPYCPDALLVPDETQPNLQKWRLKRRALDGSTIVFADAQLWAIRGAVNAGMAVFLHLDQIERGATKPKLPFNRCEELSTASN